MDLRTKLQQGDMLPLSFANNDESRKRLDVAVYAYNEKDCAFAKPDGERDLFSFKAVVLDELEAGFVTAIEFAHDKVFIHNTLTDEPATLNSPENFDMILQKAIEQERVIYAASEPDDLPESANFIEIKGVPHLIPRSYSTPKTHRWLSFNHVDFSVEHLGLTGNPILVHKNRKRILWENVVEITDVGYLPEKITVDDFFESLAAKFEENTGEKLGLPIQDLIYWPATVHIFAKDGGDAIDRFIALKTQIQPALSLIEAESFSYPDGELADLIHSFSNFRT